MAGLTADDFDRLFRQTNKKLTDYARSLLKNSSKRLPSHSTWDAEDAVSEAWVKALTADWTDTRTPEALLITFVKFAALAVIRDAQSIVDLDYDRGETEYRLLDSGYPGLEDPETHAAWAEVLPLLSEKQAVCVWMICIGGYTRDEVARLSVVPSISSTTAATMDSGSSSATSGKDTDSLAELAASADGPVRPSVTAQPATPSPGSGVATKPNSRRGTSTVRSAGPTRTVRKTGWTNDRQADARPPHAPAERPRP